MRMARSSTPRTPASRRARTRSNTLLATATAARVSPPPRLISVNAQHGRATASRRPLEVLTWLPPITRRFRRRMAPQRHPAPSSAFAAALALCVVLGLPRQAVRLHEPWHAPRHSGRRAVRDQCQRAGGGPLRLRALRQRRRAVPLHQRPRCKPRRLRPGVRRLGDRHQTTAARS